MPATPPTRAELYVLAERVALRVMTWLRKRGGALAPLVGCAGLLGFEGFVVREAPADAGDLAEGGGSEPAEADWYVSLDGDDENDGSRARPLRSPSEAVQRASKGLATRKPQRIAICEGEYTTEPLNIEGDVAVRGGCDCDSWTRPAPDETKIGASR